MNAMNSCPALPRRRRSTRRAGTTTPADGHPVHPQIRSSPAIPACRNCDYILDRASATTGALGGMQRVRGRQLLRRAAAADPSRIRSIRCPVLAAWWESWRTLKTTNSGVSWQKMKLAWV